MRGLWLAARIAGAVMLSTMALVGCTVSDGSGGASTSTRALTGDSYSCSAEGRHRLAEVDDELKKAVPQRFNWWEQDDCDDHLGYSVTFTAEDGARGVENQLARARCQEKAKVWHCPWRSAGTGHEVLLERGDSRAEWALRLS